MMYLDMYKGVLRLLEEKPDREDLDKMKDFGKIPHFLDLCFDVDATYVNRILTLHFVDLPDIIMVLTYMPKGKENAQYSDYIIYKGELCKIVVFNLDMLHSENKKEVMYHLSYSIWKTVFTPVEMYSYLNDRRVNQKTMFSATNVMYYAPAVIITKILDKLFDTDNNSISDILKLFYTPSITEEGVNSIRKLVDDVGIEMLLDYSMWNAVDDTNYPGAHFAESKQDEEESKEDNDKTD